MLEGQHPDSTPSGLPARGGGKDRDVRGCYA